MLRPEDVVVLLALVHRGEPMVPIHEMASRLFVSPSRVHASLQRAALSKLVRLSGSSRRSGQKKVVNRAALEELLVHGVKYVYPAEVGTETRGVLTAGSAPFFGELVPEAGLPWVWPDNEGEARGLSFSPLLSSAPKIARSNERLYELLVYVDALRGGAARERRIAKDRLVRFLKDRK